ncbi:trypsin-like serine protease [Actinospica durhamensis]|uniref:Trypsin-like serine protease n=1 Tax=Actinospica durhamensis TaxID=1508375 RepID=A0A941ENS3_9ACTN|nr:S1 family peptidase [Actinospica durhamensis]MBR7833778.1 trypsin-like serine protease [Actinospica durhamensis]
MRLATRCAVALAATAVVTVSGIAAAVPASAVEATPGAAGAAGAAIHELDAQDYYPDTAFGVTAPDHVVVEVSDNADPDEIAAIESAVAADEAHTGAHITVTTFHGDLRPGFVGGDAIYRPRSRCSAAFNVLTREGQDGFLTAGHCGDNAWANSTWEANFGITVATTVNASFNDPAKGYPDYALARYTAAAASPAAVNLYDGQQQRVYVAGNAYVGESVEKSGSTSGLSAGMVTGLDVTVNYVNGTRVQGMIETDMCARPGDSGGALFDKGIALGITSGGSVDCAAGTPQSFYQPIIPALQAYGATLKVSD